MSVQKQLPISVQNTITHRTTQHALIRRYFGTGRMNKTIWAANGQNKDDDTDNMPKSTKKHANFSKNTRKSAKTRAKQSNISKQTRENYQHPSKTRENQLKAIEDPQKSSTMRGNQRNH